MNICNQFSINLALLIEQIVYTIKAAGYREFIQANRNNWLRNSTFRHYLN